MNENSFKSKTEGLGKRYNSIISKLILLTGILMHQNYQLYPKIVVRNDNFARRVANTDDTACIAKVKPRELLTLVMIQAVAHLSSDLTIKSPTWFSYMGNVVDFHSATMPCRRCHQHCIIGVYRVKDIFKNLNCVSGIYQKLPDKVFSDALTN